jgi:hypothetical protein
MAESVAHFAVKSIGLSRVNGRKPCTLLDAARHNLREIQSEQGAARRIDATRIQHNVIMAGPATAADVQELARSWLASVDTSRLKRDHCQAIEAVFSLPVSSEIDSSSYFTQCLRWLTAAMNLPVLSAVIHHDEAAQHQHVLLLPLRDGCHVGGAPISRPELKRLRDSFFAQVAGPAGLKRDTAKLRGMVKQWAVAAVLRRCEGLGLPAGTGPLWPVLLAAIERDPTMALLALNIDPNSIRPADQPSSNEPSSSPIGLAQPPIGLQKLRAKPQALTCVGLGKHTTPQPPVEAATSSPELREVVSNRSMLIAPKAERLSVANATMQQTLTRQKNRPTPPQLPVMRKDDDGLVRVRDEYAHNMSAWD